MPQVPGLVWGDGLLTSSAGGLPGLDQWRPPFALGLVSAVVPALGRAASRGHWLSDSPVMGLFSDAKERQQAAQDAAAVSVQGCPDPLNHYDTEVNKGAVNMTVLKGRLAVRYREGYRLAHVLEQGGNTVMVFEHHHH